MKQVYPGSERIFVSVRVAALRTLCDEMEALMPACTLGEYVPVEPQVVVETFLALTED